MNELEKKCSECILNSYSRYKRQERVLLRGGSDLLFLLPHPNNDDDNNIIKDTSRLHKILNDVGIEADNCSYTYIVNCIPKCFNSRSQVAFELSTDQLVQVGDFCKPEIFNTIEEVGPHAIVVMGFVANKIFANITEDTDYLKALVKPFKTIYRDNKVKIVVDGNSYIPIYMNLSEGKYIEHQNDSFNNMFYIEEEKRGFTAVENHTVPGRYEVEMKAKEEKEISFVCSLEENIDEINVKDLIQKEEKRINKIYENSGLVKERITTKKQEKENELIKTFIRATDNFVVNRHSFGLHTLLAGYHWFLDWGRDALISFEGTLLITKRFDIARELLRTGTRDVKYGLVPNGYSGYDNRPLYNSVDASLLLFEAIQKYIDYTKDYKFVKEEMYETMKTIIENYCNGIDVDENNIYLDRDGLIVSGTENTQNTWMDVKFQGSAVTPRNGKAVEVNSLWYNANKIMQELSIRFGHPINAMKYKELAEMCKASFNDKFYNENTKCLYDVLGDGKVRPNQLFALSLTYPIIDTNSEVAKNVIDVVEKKLLNSYGLKTLAKGEENYVEVYEGDEKHRDLSYHQGITWPWLLGLYYNSLKNIKNNTENKEEKVKLEEKINKFIDKTKKTFSKEIEERGCIGSIAELYDSKTPNLPKGTIAQCWSVAEVFRIILGK